MLDNGREGLNVDRETAVTIMVQTYGHRGLASMALDRAEEIERLRDENAELRRALGRMVERDNAR